jgi:hypothetical protein
MLEIQSFLRNAATNGLNQQKIVDQLREDFGVKAKFYDDGRIILKYDQLDPKGWKHELTKECRGIILDWKNNYLVLAWPFYKFFNHFEGHVASIDWKSAIAYEKYDGTCLTVYYYENKWHWATLQMAEAEGNIHGSDITTYKELARPFVKNLIEEGQLVPGLSYTFELCTLENQLISRYATSEFRLIGARIVSDPAEKFPEITVQTLAGFSVPQTFRPKDLEQVIERADNLPELREGYVVVDKHFNRLKVKSAKYWTGFRLENHVSTKEGELALLAIDHDSEELLHYLPRFADKYYFWENGIDQLIERFDTFYETNRSLEQLDYVHLAYDTFTKIGRGFVLSKKRRPEIGFRDMIRTYLEHWPKSGARKLRVALEDNVV